MSCVLFFVTRWKRQLCPWHRENPAAAPNSLAMASRWVALTLIKVTIVTTNMAPTLTLQTFHWFYCAYTLCTLCAAELKGPRVNLFVQSNKHCINSPTDGKAVLDPPFSCGYDVMKENECSGDKYSYLWFMQTALCLPAPCAGQKCTTIVCVNMCESHWC